MPRGIEDRCSHAAHAFPPFAAIDCVTELAHARHFPLILLKLGDRPRGMRLQLCTDTGNEILTLEGEQRLSSRNTIGRRALPDPTVGPHRLGAVDLVDVDDG